MHIHFPLSTSLQETSSHAERPAYVARRYAVGGIHISAGSPFCFYLFFLEILVSSELIAYLCDKRPDSGENLDNSDAIPLF